MIIAPGTPVPAFSLKRGDGKQFTEAGFAAPAELVVEGLQSA